LALSRDALLKLARSGAAARVRELQTELETIFRTFPDLRRGTAPGRGATAPAKAREAAQGKAWSAAQRKAVSERMKKYWAARRAKKS
jgi:hypothetical protein